MCVGNTLERICDQTLAYLKTHRSRMSWGDDCGRAIQYHIIQERLKPQTCNKNIDQLFDALHLGHLGQDVGDTMFDRFKRCVESGIQKMIAGGLIIPQMCEANWSIYWSVKPGQESAAQKVGGPRPRAPINPPPSTPPRHGPRTPAPPRLPHIRAPRPVHPVVPRTPDGTPMVLVDTNTIIHGGIKNSGHAVTEAGISNLKAVFSSQDYLEGGPLAESDDDMDVDRVADTSSEDESKDKDVEMTPAPPTPAVMVH
ncbi:hypothetical protein FSARC_6974 [Fusarium sarcochroum]|uniref:Uncharacterized protein n=1 Tax=Fusarium sarcochroum TaxID=1208366 RepID=A0A8H4TWC3_9HYPO|nr:hypothetical protein FSARC_6974 [Fusarium sarcochroum]